jgi:hypothetical protein
MNSRASYQKLSGATSREEEVRALDHFEIILSPGIFKVWTAARITSMT